MTYLALLLLLPVVMRIWSIRYKARASWALTGIAFGCVVSPASLGLYATYFLGPAGIVTGLIGLISILFHGPPGYHVCLWIGCVKPGFVVLLGWQNATVELANALVWGLAYGGVGAALDWSCDQRARCREDSRKDPRPCKGS
jgi:hypothetical protein